MIVVSDTSPINYLVLVDAVHVLPLLFEKVYLPEQVAAELTHPTAPEPVGKWIAAPPAWLLIQSPARTDPTLKLGPGEVHAIALAEELHSDHLLVDEWAARDAAVRRGLHVIGTLGVLDQAARQQLIDLQSTLDRLRQTNFRIKQALVDQLLSEDKRRRQEQLGIDLT